MNDIIKLNKIVKEQAKNIELQKKQIESLREAINLLNRRQQASDKKSMHLTEKVRVQGNDINTVKGKLRG